MRKFYLIFAFLFALLESSAFAQPVKFSGQLKSNEVVVGKGNNVITTVPTGTNGQVLTLSGGVPTWAASGGGMAGTYITEIPTGVENDTNTVFTISHTSLSDTTTDFVFLENGVELVAFTHSGWSPPDFVKSGTTLTLTFAPHPSDKLIVRYRY